MALRWQAVCARTAKALPIAALSIQSSLSDHRPTRRARTRRRVQADPVRTRWQVAELPIQRSPIDAVVARPEARDGPLCNFATRRIEEAKGHRPGVGQPEGGRESLSSGIG